MKTILRFAIALVLILSAFGLKAQDGSEYLLWEKTKDYTIVLTTISPDETQIAVSAEYRDTNPDTYSIKILSVQTGEELYSIPIPNLCYPIFYTSDGRYLVVIGNGKENIIYDAKTYTIVKTLPAGSISFSADNKFYTVSELGDKSKYIRVYNSETFENVFEKQYLLEDADDISLNVFFTPNYNLLICNIHYLTKVPGPGNTYITFRLKQEIFDGKTFQKLDRQINCLKSSSVFSNNGLCAKTFPKEGSNSSQPIGFRIYDYDKDSLIWEQETSKYANLIFLKTKNYLISKYDIYESGNPEMKVFTSWNLSTKQRDKDIFCKNKANPKLSYTDKYLATTNGVSISLYDFESMFEANVSVTEQTKTASNIEIISNSENSTIAINFLENTNEQTNITLYNLSGNLVDVIYSGIPSGKIEYSTAHLATGVYLVKVETKTETFTKKTVINY